MPIIVPSLRRQKQEPGQTAQQENIISKSKTKPNSTERLKNKNQPSMNIQLLMDFPQHFFLREMATSKDG